MRRAILAATAILLSGLPGHALDQRLAGEWHTSITNQTGAFNITWIIKPDGKYSVKWQGPSTVPSDEGTLNTNANHWSKASKFGPDSGTYEFTDNNTITGNGGTLVWKRAGSPVASAAPQHTPPTASATSAGPRKPAPAEANTLFERGKALYLQDNMAAAFPLFLQAAEMGLPKAQLQTGWHYEFGKGVAKSDAKAAHWYELAASGGNSQAMKNIGTLYEEGRGVPENWMKAARFYALSAQTGNSEGEASLARAYRFGIGVKQNRAEAIKWYQRAAAQGDKESAYDAHWLSDWSNNVGFRNKEESNLVINNKLRFAPELIGADPNLFFANSQHRYSWLQGLREAVDKYEAEWFQRSAAHDAEVQEYMSKGYSKQEAESKASW